MFKNVYLIGVGLINASLAKDIKREQLASKIIGVGRDRERLGVALSMGIIDEFQLLKSVDVGNADIIIVGVPVSNIKHCFKAIQSSYDQNTLLTDVGSCKSSVIKAAADVFGELPKNLVPGHPIAGSEQSGCEHAIEHLYQNRKVILTPTENTEDVALKTITKMWQSVGADVDIMSAEQHDSILSATSHLPHMVAYNLVNYLGQRDDAKRVFNYAAGGFYDFTRIASSDPTMWADICVENKNEIIKSIDGFIHCLENLKYEIAQQDKITIHELFLRAKQLRNKNLNS